MAWKDSSDLRRDFPTAEIRGGDVYDGCTNERIGYVTGGDVRINITGNPHDRELYHMGK